MANIQHVLQEHSDILELLHKYSEWLMHYGYLDTDWGDEGSTTIDKFIQYYRMCADCGDTGRRAPATLDSPDGQECDCKKANPLHHPRFS